MLSSLLGLGAAVLATTAASVAIARALPPERRLWRWTATTILAEGAALVWLVALAPRALAPPFGVDAWASALAVELTSPRLDAVMLAVTELGGVRATAPLALFVAVVAFAHAERRPAGNLLGLVLLEEVLNASLKRLFERPRPELWRRLLELHSYAFPSGHAMSSSVAYGMAAMVLARCFPRAARPLAAAALTLVIAIGCSRVYLGAHWLTDVLAGWAAGVALLVLGAASLRLPRRED